MKLLHSEIDVVPGQRSQKQPMPEGVVGRGHCVVRLSNTTSQENAYTVRLQCENPFWQDGWYSIAALPPTGGTENAPPPGKPDQAMQNGRAVKVFVSRGGTRDIMISVNVPQKCDARAGLYPLKVIVETQVTGQAPGLRRKDRFSELPAVVIVRPFYQWNVEITPETRRVGFFRRSKDYEVSVTNEGNDWLYCDLRFPKAKDTMAESPCARVSLPPPEPGQERTVRSMPIKGTSKLRAFRGERMPQTLPINIQRVDAPSVAPMLEDAAYGVATANCRAAVLAMETQDFRPIQTDGTLVYCPLIPATLTGCLGAITQNLKGTVMMLIGLIVAANLAVFMFEQMFRQNIVAEPIVTQVKAGEPLVIAGRWVAGARVYINDDTTAQDPAPLPRMEENKARELTVQALRMVQPRERQYAAITVPQEYDGQVIKLKVQRAGFFRYLSFMLPRYKCGTPVTVGKLKVIEKPKDPFAQVKPSLQPGEALQIVGGNMGTDKGKVLVAGEFATIREWAEDRVVASAPKAQPGLPLKVQVILGDGRTVEVGITTIAPPAAPPGQPGQPGGAPADGAAGGGDGAPAATGGGAPPAGGGGAPPVVAGPVGGGARPRPPRPSARPSGDGGARAVASGRFRDALSAANASLSRNPDDAMALAVKAYAEVEADMGTARQSVERALEVARGRAAAIAYAAEGNRLAKSGRGSGDDINRAYQKAIQSDGRFGLPRVDYGAYLYGSGEMFSAKEQLEAALKVDPSGTRGSARFQREVAGKIPGIR